MSISSWLARNKVKNARVADNYIRRQASRPSTVAQYFGFTNARCGVVGTFVHIRLMRALFPRSLAFATSKFIDRTLEPISLLQDKCKEAQKRRIFISSPNLPPLYLRPRLHASHPPNFETSASTTCNGATNTHRSKVEQVKSIGPQSPNSQSLTPDQPFIRIGQSPLCSLA
ncbi:hypothetical protein BDV12DRAFT_103017 [Aspergillus spectabilis]